MTTQNKRTIDPPYLEYLDVGVTGAAPVHGHQALTPAQPQPAVDMSGQSTYHFYRLQFFILFNCIIYEIERRVSCFLCNLDIAQ